MTTIEHIRYDPSTHASPAPRRHHSIADRGGAAVGILVVAFVAAALAWTTSGMADRSVARHFELRALVAAALLAVALPLLQIVIHIRRFSGPVVRGNRDRYPRLDGLAGRVARAHANLIESLAPFGFAVVAVELVHASNRWTVAAAALYLAARVVHAAAYVAGITVIRSAAFYSGALATIVLICSAY